MTAVFAAVVKLSIVLAATFAAAGLLRRRSAALRHWVLGAGLCAAAGAPLVGPILPAWTFSLPANLAKAASDSPLRALPLSSSAVDVPTQSGVPPAVPSAPAWSIATSLTLAWALGLAVSLLVLGAGAARLAWLARRAAPVRGTWADLGRDVARAHGVHRPIALLQSTHPTLLVTWGLLRPRVLLPWAARTWTDERVRIVLQHELAHISRGDWAMQMLAASIRCVCWFHPLVWLACRRLRHESEYACDDLVLAQGVDAAHYATHLVEVAREVCRSRDGWVPAPAVAHPSTLEQRIRAMLNETRDRAPLSPTTRILASLPLAAMAVVVAVAAFSVSTTQAAAQSGFGAVAGLLIDQSGGVLPGADVTLTSAATGGTRLGGSDRQGLFEFTGVPAGSYTLGVDLPGFRSVAVPVSVARDDVRHRIIALQIGSLRETITVTGDRGASPEPARPVSRGRGPSAPADGRDPRRALLELLEETERAAASRAGSPAGTVRVGGQIKVPVKLRHVNPVYPASMQSAGIQSVVSLVARIGVDGFPVEVLPAREMDGGGAPHPDLVAAAIDAVQQWEFSPTLLNGVPVEVSINVSISFALP